MRGAILGLLLVACSSGAPDAPRVEAEPEPEARPEAPDPASAARPPPPAPAAPAREPETRRAVTARPDDVERGPLSRRLGPDQLPLRTLSRFDRDAPLSWEEPSHPDPALRSRLARVAEAFATEFSRSNAGLMECRATVARPDLYGMLCEGRTPGRMAIPRDMAELRVAIADGELWPWGPEAFEDPPDFAALTREACEARRAERARDEQYELVFSEHGCDPAVAYAFATATGMRVSWDFGIDPWRFPNALAIEVETPWAELAEHLAPRSPLRVLVDADATSAPPDRGDGANAWSVGGWGLPDEALRRWAALPAAHREHVELARDAASGLVRLVSRDRARATAAAEALGVPSRGARVGRDDTRRVHLARAAHDTTLRTHGGREAYQRGRATGVVPRGTILVVAGEVGSIGDWPDVLAGPLHGRASSRILAGFRVCVAEPPASLGDPTGAVRARVTVWRGGEESLGWLFAATRDGHTRVVLHAARGCELGDVLLDARAPGALFDLRVTTTEAEGGETLVILGTDGGRYRVWRPGAPEAILEFSHAGERVGEARVRLGETADGAYFPLTVASPLRRYAWVGGALVAR